MAAVSSSFKGLTWDRNDSRWRVRINYAGKQQNVGRFLDEAEAARAYDRAAVHLFGATAATNFGAAAALADASSLPPALHKLLEHFKSKLVVPLAQPSAPPAASAFAPASAAGALAAGAAGAAPAVCPAAKRWFTASSKASKRQKSGAWARDEVQQQRRPSASPASSLDAGGSELSCGTRPSSIVSAPAAGPAAAAAPACEHWVEQWLSSGPMSALSGDLATLLRSDDLLQELDATMGSGAVGAAAGAATTAAAAQAAPVGGPASAAAPEACAPSAGGLDTIAALVAAAFASAPARDVAPAPTQAAADAHGVGLLANLLTDMLARSGRLVQASANRLSGSVVDLRLPASGASPASRVRLDLCIVRDTNARP